jgi:Spy/CpxP family protein refolding chaperone
MRNFALSLGALVLVATALPVVQVASADETVIVKHGHHHHGWDRDHHHSKKIIIKHDHD